MGLAEADQGVGGEFSIPGGVLVSTGHCWISLAEDGTAKVGLDDFARKLLGTIDSINFPNVGMNVTAGQHRRARFNAPLSGKVVKVNEDLGKDCTKLEEMSYGDNWICVIEGNDLDAELPNLKIGKSAVVLFQEDIVRFQASVQELSDRDESDPSPLFIGAIGKMNDARWETTVKEFFGT